MNKPEEKVKEIQNIFKIISSILDDLNDDNFDLAMGQVNKNIHWINKLVKNFRNHYDNETLTKFNVEIEPLIKHINFKFDNIINKIKAEQSEISIELNNFQNQKKLANYNR
jgi:hypothetical protein